MSSSSMTVLVEKATSDLLIGPDWTLNMDICDSLNSDRWQAKDVVKAVKKRLQHKSPNVQFLALTLLTMIKNCGGYLHFQVVEREILQEMVKMVKKKADMQVSDKILVLLDFWQEAFGGAGEKYPQFYWAYSDLKRFGVQFPERSPDATLIFTPAVHATPAIRHPRVANGMSRNSNLRFDEAMPSEMENLSSSDLASMQNVMELLSEMLQAVNPNDRAAVKDEVILDLVDQCHSNKAKLMQLIYSIRDEELLCQGLELNDNLQSLLAKHDTIASGSPLPSEVSESIPSPRTPIVPQPAATYRYDDEEEDEDDGFAQLARRNSNIKPVGADSNSVATSDQLGSPNQSAVMLSTGASGVVDGTSSSAASTALPSHILSTPPIKSDQNASPLSFPPTGQAYLHSPESYAVNQSYIPQNNFVSPWAQTQVHPPSPLQAQPQSEVFLDSSGYPPPPWATAPDNANANAILNPFASTAYQYPALSTNGDSAVYTSMHASRPLRGNDSFGSMVSNAPATISEARINVNNIGQIGPPTAPQPYVYKNRLFDDLPDLNNAGTGLKTSGPASSVQDMFNGRK